MGSPPSENEKRPDFSDLCVIIQFTKLGFNNETGYNSLPEYIERLKGPQRYASYRGSALHSPRRFPVCNAPRRRNSRRQQG